MTLSDYLGDLKGECLKYVITVVYVTTAMTNLFCW